jgi:hypothetical protein
VRSMHGRVTDGRKEKVYDGSQGGSRGWIWHTEGMSDYFWRLDDTYTGGNEHIIS